jgi:uncharacterized integral membrane protein
MIFPLIIGFVLGAAAIVFALQNTDVVALTFLGYAFESSLALLVLITFAAGMLLALLVTIPAAIRDGLRILSLKGENKKLKEESDRLRTEATGARAETEAYRSAPVAVVQTDEPGPVLDMRQ